MRVPVEQARALIPQQDVAAEVLANDRELVDDSRMFEPDVHATSRSNDGTRIFAATRHRTA
jgi:hypothetical protein